MINLPPSDRNRRTDATREAWTAVLIRETWDMTRRMDEPVDPSRQGVTGGPLDSAPKFRWRRPSRVKGSLLFCTSGD